MSAEKNKSTRSGPEAVKEKASREELYGARELRFLR